MTILLKDAEQSIASQRAIRRCATRLDINRGQNDRNKFDVHIRAQYGFNIQQVVICSVTYLNVQIFDCHMNIDSSFQIRTEDFDTVVIYNE